MEISLFALDLDTLLLTFAGAGRPLWIVRNNENVQKEILQRTHDILKGSIRQTDDIF
jgi:hypothetical protein